MGVILTLQSDFQADKQCIQSRSSHCGAVETNLTSIHEDAVRSVALLSGLRIQHCHELWCRSQTQLGSCVAVALVEAGLGSSICCECSSKKTKKKKVTGI